MNVLLHLGDILAVISNKLDGIMLNKVIDAIRDELTIEGLCVSVCIYVICTTCM